MKKLVNLKGVKALNKNEQKEIYGGLKRGPGCQELWVSADCCHQSWNTCFPFYTGYCIDGFCVM